MARPGPQGGQYRPLLEEQILRIHQASLTVLETTGIKVENEEAKRLFQSGGARSHDDQVFLSTSMVEAALETVPSRLVLAGRDPSQDVVLEGRRAYAGTGGSPTMVLDPGADAVHPGTLRDLAELARVVDALECCDFLAIPLYPTDVPPEDVHLSSQQHQARHEQ